MINDISKQFIKLEQNLRGITSSKTILDEKTEALINQKIWTSVPIDKSILTLKERVKVFFRAIQITISHLFNTKLPPHLSDTNQYIAFLAEGHIKKVEKLANLCPVVTFLNEQDPRFFRTHSKAQILEKLATFDSSFIAAIAEGVKRGVVADSLIELITAPDLEIKSGTVYKNKERRWKAFKNEQKEEAKLELTELKVTRKKRELLRPFILKNNEIEKKIKNGSVDYKTLIIEMQQNTQRAVEVAFAGSGYAGGDQMIPLNMYLLSKSSLSYDTLTQLEKCKRKLRKIDKSAAFSVEPLFPIHYLSQLESFKTKNK